MTTPRKVPFYKPSFPPDSRRAVAASIEGLLESGQLMMGPFKDKLEDRFRGLTGCGHAVSLNSATTGLQIALQFFGAKDHDVLVPAAAFLTDVSAVLFAGGRPLLVDVDPETMALDLDDLARKITPRTKGIIWVHLTGLISADYERIIAFASERGLFLIEDASHAHGAEIDGRRAGSLGDAGIFSFYPTKVVTAGTGGMLTTNDAALANFAEEMRIFGKDARGEIVRLGNDWFLDEIRACVGYHHASDLERQLARRRDIASRYTRLLEKGIGFRPAMVAPRHAPSWYHYCVILDDCLDRASLVADLAKEDGITAKQIYKPVHHEQVFRHLDDGGLRGAEQLLDRAIALPLYVDMTDDDVDYVASRLMARTAAYA